MSFEFSAVISGNSAMGFVRNLLMGRLSFEELLCDPTLIVFQIIIPGYLSSVHYKYL